MVVKRKFIITLILVAILIYSLFFIFSLSQTDGEDRLMSDIARLYPQEIRAIESLNQTNQFVSLIADANQNELSVSIGGKRHSQGGHTYYKDAVYLDMTQYNEILSFDEVQGLLTVQSGATWENIQEYLNPLNYSIAVMQSSNIFTIGGSLSANIHGRDPQFGSIIETVDSFRLLLANETIMNVSRDENNDLFAAVIGGYGAYGIILDATILVVPNVVYEKQVSTIQYTEYPSVLELLENDSQIGLHYGRLSIVPGVDFLREAQVINYVTVNKSTSYDLSDETYTARDKFFFGLSRSFDWAKESRWKLQNALYDNPGELEIVTRNNAMRPPIAFLEHDTKTNSDILQEYFVPYDGFVPFLDAARQIFEERNVNILSVTLRHVKQDTESLLPYATNDGVAIVFYINQGLSSSEKEEAQQWTQQLVDEVISVNGTYYLTYQLYPTKEQLVRVYPQFDEYVLLKERYDSKNRFMNTFYAYYVLGENYE